MPYARPAVARTSRPSCEIYTASVWSAAAATARRSPRIRAPSEPAIPIHAAVTRRPPAASSAPRAASVSERRKPSIPAVFGFAGPASPRPSTAARSPTRHTVLLPPTSTPRYSGSGMLGCLVGDGYETVEARAARQEPTRVALVHRAGEHHDGHPG